MNVVKAAVGFVLAGDKLGLSRLRSKFGDADGQLGRMADVRLRHQRHRSASPGVPQGGARGGERWTRSTPSSPRTARSTATAETMVPDRSPAGRRLASSTKLRTSEPATRCQPSTSTKKISLNGSEITTGGSIIMPIDISTDATTMSMMTKGRNKQEADLEGAPQFGDHEGRDQDLQRDRVGAVGRRRGGRTCRRTAAGRLLATFAAMKSCIGADARVKASSI